MHYRDQAPRHVTSGACRAVQRASSAKSTSIRKQDHQQPDRRRTDWDPFSSLNASDARPDPVELRGKSATSRTYLPPRLATPTWLHRQPAQMVLRSHRTIGALGPWRISRRQAGCSWWSASDLDYNSPVRFRSHRPPKPLSLGIRMQDIESLAVLVPGENYVGGFAWRPLLRRDPQSLRPAFRSAGRWHDGSGGPSNLVPPLSDGGRWRFGRTEQA